MNKTREFQHFFYGQYFADGMRITVGTIIPTLIFAYFGNLQIGTTISFGALVIGLSDTPGPLSHRRNGMLICTLITLITALLTILVNGIPGILFFVIVALSFFYSMFAVYGARASTLGAMGILVMILTIDIQGDSFLAAFQHLGYTMIGCVWYMLLSLSVTHVRPYRLAQQELGESIHNVASFIRLKANFYDSEVDYEKNYLALIEQQILVHEHQDNVRDLVFRSKKAIKDTTQKGRMLVLVFSDIIDLFEQSMATHYDYKAINEQFGHTGVLRHFKLTINRISNELDHLGREITANKIPKSLYQFKNDLERLRLAIEKVEKEHQLNTLPLKKILINVRNIVQRLDQMYGYFTLKKANVIRKEEADYSKFISKQEFDLKIFKENITLDSSTFRHAIRMSIMMGIGYVIGQSFNIGSHSYWILLTILVILKPGFGLTKQRNFQRLAGTIIGGIGGTLILILIPDQSVLFIILLLCMIATYSFIRINYIVSVMFMTPFILIMFNFFEENTFQIAQERVLDTLIGSSLAFISSYIILPNWESTHLQSPMRKLMIANYHYIAQALQIIGGSKPDVTSYKLARKEMYVATANMGSAFQRLITEPKSKQKNAKEINKFVVFNHILSSYSVTLLNLVRHADQTALTGEHVKSIRKTLFLLSQSIRNMEAEEGQLEFQDVEVSIPSNLDDNNIDSSENKLITDQLNFLNRIAQDIHKTCQKLIQNESTLLETSSTKVTAD
jgi:uncharacterized membrane protein (TIGR01666 family)